MNTFTPGPWWVDDPDCAGCVDIMAGSNIVVCELDGHCCDITADARLIAAAPELYEALRAARVALIAVADSAVEAGFDRMADIIDEQLGKANAAIDKADGES